MSDSYALGEFKDPGPSIAMGSLAYGIESIAVGANSTDVGYTTNTIVGSGSSGANTWITTGGANWGIPAAIPAPEHPEYENREGQIFEAEQLVSDKDELERVARWVGAKVFPTSGLRVPTLEGVQALFIGDWVVKDEDGIVYLYDNTDFANEFKRRV